MTTASLMRCWPLRDSFAGTSSPSALVARAGEYEYVPLEGMPDPDKAVFNAQRSVGQVTANKPT